MAAKRTERERERDKPLITDYYLKGYSYREIAQNVSATVGNGYSISHVTVANEINALIDEWRENSISDIERRKAIELEKLHKLEYTYWQAWHKSTQDHKTQTRMVRQARTKTTEVTETDVISMGNPAYLAGIERCIQTRCKILGVNAPDKKEISGPNGQPLQADDKPDYSNLTTDEKIALLELIRKTKKKDAAE